MGRKYIFEIEQSERSGESLAQPLVGETFASAVRECDDAAVAEAVLQDKVLHYEVVFVGVYAYIAAARFAEIHDGGEDAVRFRVARYPVYDHVWAAVLCPVSVCY